MGSLRAGPRSDGPEPRQAGTLLVLHTRTRASVRASGTRVVGKHGLLARSPPPSPLNSGAAPTKRPIASVACLLIVPPSRVRLELQKSSSEASRDAVPRESAKTPNLVRASPTFRLSRACEHTFVTAQPHAHVRFRRAIERRALWLAGDARSRSDAVCPRWGGEGAVVPQLSPPIASGLLSCSCRPAHTPSEAGRVAARHKRGPRLGGNGNGRRFHFPHVRPRHSRATCGSRSANWRRAG